MRSIPTSCPTVELKLAGATAFSTERGCTRPSAPYDGISACHYTGDSAEAVGRSRELIAERLGLTADRLVIPRQTHSLNIAAIGDDWSGEALEDVDGLVTRRRDIALCVNTADCVPIVLVDATAGVLSVVHSGWRGTVGRIAARAVERMCAEGALPCRIEAAMGPCICADCFEVGEEVASEFRREFDLLPGIVVDDRGPRPHVDLPAAIRATLIDAGLAAAHIAGPPGCSRCEPERFFSARRLGVASGRTLTAARLR